MVGWSGVVTFCIPLSVCIDVRIDWIAVTLPWSGTACQVCEVVDSSQVVAGNGK